MAKNSLTSLQPPSTEDQSRPGVTYYEARRGNGSADYPFLNKRTLPGGEQLAMVNPGAIPVIGLRVWKEHATSTHLFLYAIVPRSYANATLNPYRYAYPSGEENRRSRLLLQASGFDNHPGFNGQTFPCSWTGTFGISSRPNTVLIYGVDQEILKDRELFPEATSQELELTNPSGNVIGYLGCNFVRVHEGDPEGFYELAWEEPSSGPEPDFYNVYQRHGQLWRFAGSTSSTNITIDNVEADSERGPPRNLRPLSNDLLTVHVPDRLPAENFFSEHTFPHGFREIEDQDYKKFPQCSTFFEQRQVYAGSQREPETIHMSKTALFNDFSYSQPRQDDDAINRALASGIAEEIRHMVWFTDLLIFTSRKEYRLRAPTGGAVTPNTISASPQSFYGSSHAAPVFARDKVLVVERGGKEIRDFKYDFDADVFSGDELTILAPHLFENDRILEMDYHEGDTSLLFVVTESGRLLVQTKDDALEINGWGEWVTNRGKFRSVAVLRSANNTSVIMFTVERMNAQNEPFHSIEFVEFEGLNSKVSWTDSSVVKRDLVGTAEVHVEAAPDGSNPQMILTDVQIGDRDMPATIILTGMKQTGDGSPAYRLLPPAPFSSEPPLYAEPPDSQPLFEESDLNGTILTVGDQLSDSYEISPNRDETTDGLMRRLIAGTVQIWKPVTEVDGLDHLENRWVSIGVDDEPLVRRQVMGGKIVLENSQVKDERGREVNVGLEYTMHVKTPPLAVFSDEDTALYASTMRCSRVIVDSHGTDGMRVAASGGTIPPASRFKEVARDKSAADENLVQISLDSPMTRDLSLIFAHGDPTPAALRWFTAYINSGDDG